MTDTPKTNAVDILSVAAARLHSTKQALFGIGYMQASAASEAMWQLAMAEMRVAERDMASVQTFISEMQL